MQCDNLHDFLCASCVRMLPQTFELRMYLNNGRHVRCVVATLGGTNGAAAQFSRWSGLHSGISVWLSQSQAQGMPVLHLF
jgi:hypothetical protein